MLDVRSSYFVFDMSEKVRGLWLASRSARDRSELEGGPACLSDLAPSQAGQPGTMP